MWRYLSGEGSLSARLFSSFFVLLPMILIVGCDSSSPTAPRVIADFTFSGEGASLQFVDNSMGPVRTWQWHFGDGDSSIDQSPSHRYFAGDLPRTYSVTLEVCPSTRPDASNCDKVAKNIRVFTVGPPG